MNRSHEIARDLRSALAGPTWHGDPVQQLLRDVSASHAFTHPVPGAHSIWELVVHMTAWADIARERLRPEPAPEPTDAEDWPAVVAHDDAAWTAANASLSRAYEALAAAVEQQDDSTLDVTVPRRDHTTHHMLRGVVEHAAYHGGQIGLLKRALQATPAPA